MKLREAAQWALLLAAMGAVGAVGWSRLLAAPLVPDASALSALPQSLESWRGRDLPIDQAVESMLRADFNLQRAYLHPLGDLIWLYVGYYGTDRGGRPEHTPGTCYRANGWTVLREAVVPGLPGGPPRVNEMLVEQDGERRLVHFWYRSGSETGVLGGIGLSLARLRRWVSERRGDGALVRISTPLRDGDEEAARTRLRAFAARLDPELARRWPAERRSTRTASRSPEGG